MSTFPFDPAPFVLKDHDAIEVEGRPARVRVIHGELRRTNEDLSIATIVPMPQVGANNQIVLQPIHLAIEERLAENDAGWGHWALPPPEDNFDLELHAGEFMNLNDMVEPAPEVAINEMVADDDSELTLTLNISAISDITNDSVQEIIHAEVTEAVLQAPPLALDLFDLNFPAADIEEVVTSSHATQELQSDIQLNIPQNETLAENSSITPQVNANLSLSCFVPQGPVAISAILSSTLVSDTETELPSDHAPAINTSLVHNEMIKANSQKVLTSSTSQDLAAALPVSMENLPADMSGSQDLGLLPGFPLRPGTEELGPPPCFPLPLYEGITHNTLHINTMQFESDVADPVFQKMMESNSYADEDELALGKEGALLWNFFFAPSSISDKVINVPNEWANFLSLALLSPNRFEWAKSLLASQLWSYILEGSDCNKFKPFVIPDVCFDAQVPGCGHVSRNIQKDETNEPSTPKHGVASDQANLASTTAVHYSRKRKDKAPLVETEVRRSERLKHLQKGFRKSACANKNCISCNNVPPFDSTKIVRNLSVSFCKVALGAAQNRS
ncbi:unnamed protein product [Alopecurus aequalis]